MDVHESLTTNPSGRQSPSEGYVSRVLSVYPAKWKQLD